MPASEGFQASSRITVGLVALGAAAVGLVMGRFLLPASSSPHDATGLPMLDASVECYGLRISVTLEWASAIGQESTSDSGSVAIGMAWPRTWSFSGPESEQFRGRGLGKPPRTTFAGRRAHIWLDEQSSLSKMIIGEYFGRLRDKWIFGFVRPRPAGDAEVFKVVLFDVDGSLLEKELVGICR